MRVRRQSVAICFFLAAGGFSLTQPGSLGMGAEPSKRQGFINAQFEPERLLERDVRRFVSGHPGASAERITAYAKVLAISPTGIRFEVAAKALAGQEGSNIPDFPEDPNNAYLAYSRFRVKDKTYIIRYSGPCT